MEFFQIYVSLPVPDTTVDGVTKSRQLTLLYTMICKSTEQGLVLLCVVYS